MNCEEEVGFSGLFFFEYRCDFLYGIFIITICIQFVLKSICHIHTAEAFSLFGWYQRVDNKLRKYRVALKNKGIVTLADILPATIPERRRRDSNPRAPEG